MLLCFWRRGINIRVGGDKDNVPMIRVGHSNNLDVGNGAGEGKMESHYKRARNVIEKQREEKGKNLIKIIPEASLLFFLTCFKKLNLLG